MYGDVEAHELDECLIIPEAKECGQVGGVVLRGVDGGKFTLAINVAVNATGNVRQLGNPRV